MQALFKADWCDTNFLHFEIDADALQRYVPFELDRFHDRAFVSLVAFRQRRLRPVLGGRIAAIISSPLSDHEFLNLRTYVRHNDERAIFFLAEWIPNRLAALLGPMMYGLPYRLGRLDYRNDEARGAFTGRVIAPEIRFDARGRFHGNKTHAQRGSIEEFLVERYVAFTSRQGIARRFQITHQPWPIIALRVEALRIEPPLPFHWELVCAHHSSGVRDVQISAPSIISPAALVRRSRYRPRLFGSAGYP